MWIRTTYRDDDGTPLATMFNPSESEEPIHWSAVKGVAQVTDELGETLIERYGHAVEEHDPDGDEPDPDTGPVEKSGETPDDSNDGNDESDTPAGQVERDSGDDSGVESDATDGGDSGEIVAETDIVIDTTTDGDDSTESTESAESTAGDGETGADGGAPSDEPETEPESQSGPDVEAEDESSDEQPNENDTN